MTLIAGQLLSTKLFIPSPRPQLVNRTHLFELLEQGADRKLTLISAPAGFGKTTLVTQWHQLQPQRPLAWLSLDEADNEPVHFLRYLVAAFRTFATDECEDILLQLDNSEQVWVEAILTRLINVLTNLITRQSLNRMSLVLDDYHLIQNQTIHTALTFLLDHLPPQLHLIITTRSDPLLPLARLRAKNQLLEIRALELRFQLEETTAFVMQDSKLKQLLTAEDIAKLAIHTEGWAAGLQLALLWLRGRENVAEALKTFSGNNRFVLEYLAEEVLNHQSELLRTFLLQTSVLERFNASLASAVTGREWQEEDLAQLEQANLFLVPLDDQGEWYRYHQLFTEFLQHRLKRETPSGLLAELHLRASQWFEKNNLIREAIKHALAASDYERAASLIEQIAWPIISLGELNLVDNWLTKIPQEVLYAHPYLCLYTGSVFYLKGRLVELAKLLEAAQSAIKAAGEVDKLRDYFHLQSHLARQQNRLAATLEYTEQTLALIPAAQIGSRAVAGSAPAHIYLNQGEVNKALPFIDLLLVALRREETHLGRLFTGLILGDLYLLQGQLPLAEATHQEIIKIASVYSRPSILSYLRLANIYLEWNKLDQAQIYLNKLEEFDKQLGEFYIPPGYYIYSGLWWPDGDQLSVLDWSNATNQQIEQYWQENYKAQFIALKIRFRRNMAGRISELEKWCEETFPGGYPALPQPLDYQREPQYLTLVRLLIYQGRREQALALLNAVKQLAQKQGRTHSLIKILALLAICSSSPDNPQKHKNIPSEVALANLREGLLLAEPGGYIRVFVEEGEALKALLAQCLLMLEKGEKEDNRLGLYARKLLAAFETEENTEPDAQAALPEITIENQLPLADTSHKLPEPLTERELEVLRLIAKGASNQEIATRLVITLSTVKKHSTNIFDKLGVRNRTQALLTARELTLI